MNPKVQEFLEKKKAEELETLDKKKAEELEKERVRRNKHLIRIGLIDKEKSSTIAYNQSSYGIENVAIEVTDEEYAEICKYYPEEENIEKNQYTELKMKEDISSIKSWVKFWSIFSIVLMVIAIIVSIAKAN